MNTFVKVLLLVLLALVAIKLLPVTLGIGCVLALALVALLALGASFVAVGLLVALFLAAVLSPIWIPIVLLLGLIALLKRSNGKPAST